MSQSRNVAVGLGTAATLIAVVVTYLGPAFIPLEAVREFLYSLTGQWMFGNPFKQFRLAGGLGGGLVAGYVSEHSDWETKVLDGIRAALYGLGIVYIAYVIYTLAEFVVDGMFPPPVYTVVVVPLIVIISLFPAYLLGGAVGGLVGHLGRVFSE